MHNVSVIEIFLGNCVQTIFYQRKNIKSSLLQYRMFLNKGLRPDTMTIDPAFSSNIKFTDYFQLLSLISVDYFPFMTSA